MIKLLKNANVYAPEKLGKKDILIEGEKILLMQDTIEGYEGLPGVETYDLEGKTVVPFCTYASTYRDETLARIVELTPDAAHLTGEGLTSGRINEQNISSWLREIGLIE